MFLASLRQIDLFMGALDGNIITNGHFIASHAYYHDALTWCVQSKQPIPMWKNIFRLYADPVPMGISLTSLIFLFIFIEYFLQQFEQPNKRFDCHKILLIWICTYTSFVCSYMPKVLSHRIFYAFHIFSSMIFGAIYLSFSMRTLSKPMYDNQIRTIDEIVNSSFELVGDAFTLQHLMKQKEVRLFNTILFEFSFNL